MGMFDSFFHPCPQCGTEVEWQTKAGPCQLRECRVGDCPPDIAGGLDGKSEVCPKCKRTLTVTVQTLITVQ